MLNWLSNLFSQFGKNKLERYRPHIEAIAVHNSSFFNDPYGKAEQSTIYSQSSWVHVAVNRIAEAGALVPLKVLRLQGEQRIEVERHPLEQLLDNPNPAMSRFELFEATLGFLELTGNAYWFIVGDELGRPAQLWPLRPERVTIIPHPQNYVAGYIYEVDGYRIPLDAIEVIHFKRWNPGNDYYGLSALEAARLAVDSDRSMARWNKNTFGQDNGVPAGIVNIAENVNDEDFDRIKREWRNSYGSGQRRTAFLRGGTIAWQHIGLSHTDLDFLNGRQAHRDEILNIFGIPVGLVSENATEANAKVAERLFIERTLWPKLTRIAQKISQELLPFYPGEHIALFDDIRPTDMQARLDEIRVAQAVLSINEIRERYYNLPTVIWGNLPIALQQLDDKAGATRQVTPTHDAAPTNENESNHEPDSTKSIHEELAQWERFAIKRLGKEESRAFEVKTIPDEIAFEVSAGLLFAEDRDAVKAVFAEARDLLDPSLNPSP